jgi:hypothetical protein
MALNPGVSLAILLTLTPQADSTVVLENEYLRVEFSARDGAFTRLLNRQTQLELISIVPRPRKPWVFLLAPTELVSDYVSFRVVPSAPKLARELMLEWDTRQRITVRVTARLEAGADQLELRVFAENRGDRTILALRYPAIQGIGILSSDGTGDRLLHSNMMGALFFDPFHLFDGKSPVAAARGLTAARYPNGFLGSPLQMISYYAQGRGGVYIACHDPDGADKDLNFYKSLDDTPQSDAERLFRAVPGLHPRRGSTRCAPGQSSQRRGGSRRTSRGPLRLWLAAWIIRLGRRPRRGALQPRRHIQFSQGRAETCPQGRRPRESHKSE